MGDEFDIERLIASVRKRPEMYLGGRSIWRLKAFLDGVYYYREVVEGKLSPDAMSGFRAWVARRHSLGDGYSWAQIIFLDSGDECEALERFFEEWRCYCESLSVE